MSRLLHMSKLRIIALTLTGCIAASAAGVQTVEAAHPGFIASTAYIINPQHVHFGILVYVAPFALLQAGTDPAHAIHIGSATNVQDSVTVATSRGAVGLGEHVILAHGAAR